MTDIEIIKALECCSSEFECHNGCPYYNNGEFKCRNLSFYKDTLDLVNRQQTEIDILIRKKETLRDEIAEQQAEIERLKYILECEEAKYDKCAKHFYKVGVKDFAERLKVYLLLHHGEIYGVLLECINKLLEEMEREGK